MRSDSGIPPATELERPPKSNRILWWLGVSAVLFGLVGVIGAVLYYGYTKKLGWVGVSDKKFWDYLDLLIAPAAIAIGVTLLNWMQNMRAIDAEEKRRKQEHRMEDAQRLRELEVEDRRAQDEALQAYLDQMSTLLLDKDLRSSKENSEARNLARARTLTILARFDGTHERSILQFLYESGLVNKDDVVVELKGADLSEASLDAINLHGADLSEANLSGADLNAASLSLTDLSDANLSDANLMAADLSAAHLMGADLLKADLSGANLREAKLNEVDLRGAHLSAVILHGADLSGADLSDRDLSDANMRGADLSDANMRDADLRSADLSRADLSETYLRGAKLNKANLTEAHLLRADLSGAELKEARLIAANLIAADLSGANLSEANMRGADLSDANLTEAHLLRTDLSKTNLLRAKGVTNEEIAQRAQALAGATLPDGQRYEQWLKHNEVGEVGKNASYQ